MEALKIELARLSLELEQTSSEKNQAAQYGLVLLEEKEQLEIRNAELEARYDYAVHEMHVAQDALAKFQTSQLVRAWRTPNREGGN